MFNNNVTNQKSHRKDRSSSTPKKNRVMVDTPIPIEIDLQEEEKLLNSDSEENTLYQSSEFDTKLNNISENLSGLEVGSQSRSSEGHSSLVTSDTTLGDSEIHNKRGRSNDNSMAEEQNPTKKLRTLLGSFPSMAEAVKSDIKGHVIDISLVDNKAEFNNDNNMRLQLKLNEALFSEEDISDLKFDEPPSFDGSRLRLICSNEITKNWVENTIPNLADLWEGAQLKVTVVGPPPKLVRASIVMPAPTYEPAVLLSIISAQNPAIDTKFWKYQSRTKVDRGKQTWFIGVDENSIPALKELGFRPHVGLGRIKISVSNQPAQ